jgi:hypothetical protein
MTAQHQRAQRARRRAVDRLAHRSQLRRELDVDDDVGVLVGWCNGDGTLEEAKKATHDALIGLMGARRTGGVTWRIYGVPAAYDVLDRIVAGERSPELLDHYRHLRGLLREHGGLMVAATAPGRPT